MNFPDDGFEMDQQMGPIQQDMVYQPPDTGFGHFSSHQPSQPHPPGPISSKEQAIMWQQNHYMGAESGFISAATTQPSSITGHEDDAETNCYTGPSSVIGTSIYDLDSAHISEVNSCHSTQDLGSSDPEELILKFINYLQDDDQVVVTEYLTFIDRCVNKESFFNAFSRSLPFVGAIIQRLVSATDTMAALEMANNNNNNNGEGEAIQQQQQLDFNQALSQAKLTSKILRLITNNKPPGDQREGGNQWVACQNILTAGGIPPITRLLACTTDRIMINALVTIHSLLLCFDQKDVAKNAVRESNGVQLMVALLKRDDPKLLIIIADCLRILAVKNQPTKMIILQGEGPTLLVNIMKKKDYPNLILMTARLLKVLAVCPMIKPAIIAAGGMEALARHLNSSHSKITYQCIWTMRNLSDVATDIQDPGALAFQLVKLLSHSEKPIIVCAAGIISNLTVFSEVLKGAICDANGVQELLSIIEKVKFEDRDAAEAAEPALCAIRHLTNNHKKAEDVQRMLIYNLQGLPKIMRFLNCGSYRACLKACLGVIRNLALKPLNHQVLREKGVMTEVLRLFSAYIQRGLEPNGLVIVDGVKWEEIIDQCLMCILYFSKDPINREIIREPVIVNRLRQLLGFNADNIVRGSVAVLAEIASDIDGAFRIQVEGLTDQVNALTQSRNEKIASYALTIMYKLTSLKNECERGTYRPPAQMSHGMIQQPPPHQMHPQNIRHQMMSGPPQSQEERFQRSFPPNMGQGFDSMMGNPIGGGAMSGGYPQQMMGGGPPPQPSLGNVGNHQGGSPQGFMDELPPDMAMDLDGLISPTFNQNFVHGFFESM